MSPSFRTGLVTLMAMAFATTVWAREGQSEPTCSSASASLPAELAAWTNCSAVKAGSDPAALDMARIDPGHAIDAGLAPTPEVHYAVRPEKPGGSVSFGGLYALKVEQPGTYRIALGSAAWIDLMRDGKAISSSAHGHGPDCSGIRKMVDFALAPGTYVLQISANASSTMPLLVARVP